LEAGAEIAALNERLASKGDALQRAQQDKEEAARKTQEHEGQLEVQIQQLRQRLEEAQKDTVQLKTRLENEQKAASEKLALIEQAKTALTDAFHSLSANALQKNNQSFLDLAKTVLGSYQDGAKSDLDLRQRNIAELIKPVQQSLEKFDSKMQTIEKERAGAYEGLTQQVRSLSQSEASLRSETAKLVKALASPAIRGRWGEIQLRRVVELAGMINRCDFFEQPNVTTEEGRLRPDLIVRLPGGKNVVVDAKAPLVSFLEAIEASDEDTKQRKLKDHARQIRDHMKALGQKSYWDQFQPAPEFVLLFLPGETFFSAALEHDPALIEQGVKDGVIIATPTTLISLLKAVAHGWRQEQLAQNAQQISDLGKELHKRIADMAGHFAELGDRLQKAVEFYNKAAGSMESRVLVSARKFRELSAASGDIQIPELIQIDQAPRQLQTPELSFGNAPAPSEPEIAEKSNGPPQATLSETVVKQA
jgi:DNA recombination protein RmuC